MVAKSLSTSEKYASLHELAGKLAEFCQALYPLLIAHADDWGRLPGDVFTVKHLVHPTSPRKLQDFDAALGALHTAGLIQQYEADEKRVIFICGWFAHQQLKGHDKDGRTSNFPPPPENANDFKVSAQSRPTAPKAALREKKGREEKGREEEEQPPPLAVVPSDEDPSTPHCKVEAFVQLWNTTVSSPISQCKGISDQRREKIRLRLKERPIGEWLAIFQRIEASGFCHGKNERGWTMSLDWLVKNDEHALRVLEGKYDDRIVSRPASPGGIPDAAATRAKYLVS